MVLPRQKTTAKSLVGKDENSLNILDVSSSNYQRPGMTERKFKVGDLIHEEHFPDRKGVIVEVILTLDHATPQSVVVQWIGRNPHYTRPGPEEIAERYIVLLSRKEK